MEKLRLQLWNFDFLLLTSDAPDLQFSFARLASCTFSIGIHCQGKGT
jgi:hypothetical protein